MSLTDQDLVLLEPQYRGDFDGAGGLQTARLLGTGQIPFDQLFPDTSDMDYLGRVDFEKFFVDIASGNTDPLLGAYVVIAAAPTETAVAGLLFPGTDTDVRSDIKAAIEAYQGKSFVLPYHLIGTHLAGQTQILFYCDAGVVAPAANLTFILSVEASGYIPVAQPVRLYSIVSVEERLFQNSNDEGEFVRTVVTADIQYPLRYDFAATLPVKYTTNPSATVIRSTQVTAGLHFYGVSALADDVEAQGNRLRVAHARIPLLPSNQTDIPVIDYRPFAGRAVCYEIESAPEVVLSLSAAANETKTVYFPLPLQPARNVVMVGALRFEDRGDGSFACVTGDASGYTVSADYAGRTVMLTRSTSWSITCTFDMTYSVTAEAPIYSQAIRIQEANRRLTYNFMLDPLPQPTSLEIRYFSGGIWYTLKDLGGGAIAGGTNEGTGTVTYETGSGYMSLGGLPDIDSAILISWCAQACIKVSTSTPAPATPLLPLWHAPLPANAHPAAVGSEPPGNHVPTANAGQPASAAVGTSIPLDAGLSSDPDPGQTLSYRWRVTGRPWQSQSEPVNRDTQTTSITPDVVGTYYLGLTVSDGWKTSTEVTKEIVATASPLPVSVPGHWQAVAVGETVHLDGSASVNPVNYAWEIIDYPPGSTAVLSAEDTVVTSFVPDLDGDYEIQLAVTNAHGSSTASTRVTTHPRPPVVSAGADQTGTIGVEVQLAGSGSHPGGLTVHYQWTVLYAPTSPAPTLQNPTHLDATFVPTAAGNYLLELVGEEQTWFSTARDTMNVFVAATVNPPTANAGADQAGTIGQAVTLSGNGSLGGAPGPLTYQWTLTTAPAGSLALISQNTSQQASVIPDVGGTYQVQLIVRDSQQASAPDYAILTVPYPAPQIFLQVPTTMVVGTTLRLDATGSTSYQPDRRLAFVWAWVANPGSLSLIEPNSAQLSIVCPLDLSKMGTYRLRLTVTDSANQTAQQEVRVDLVAPPSPPNYLFLAAAR